MATMVWFDRLPNSPLCASCPPPLHALLTVYKTGILRAMLGNRLVIKGRC